MENNKEHAFFETRRFTNADLEKIIGYEFKILDNGFIRLIDYMGGDDAIVQASRVSYGKGTKKTSEDRGLIRYLLRHRHTTPFEMCEIKLHIKLPIFVARQWIRHRTASVNEYSGRYSILDKDFYTPTEISEQSKNNKQGRGTTIVGSDYIEYRDTIKNFSLEAYNKYSFLMNFDETGNLLESDKSGIARELARMVLPTNYYTQWYWKIDLHNLLHFLSLRDDSHAQYEIRVYAEKIAEIVKLWVPHTYEAFEDYRKNAMNISSYEILLLKRIINGETIEKNSCQLSERELNEFLEKFDLDDTIFKH